MEVIGDRSGEATPFRFIGAVATVCLVVFVVTARLALPASTMPPAALSPSELRALAQQGTLRVAAASCGGLTRGSGLIIEGRLVTNAHVVSGTTEVKADQPIDPVLLPVLAIDVGSDLAIAEQPAGVSLVLASADAVRSSQITGREVTVAGHAGGGSIEVQTGVVTGRVPGAAYGYRDDILLIDVPTRGGYSGGPVLDEAGRVVAVLSGFDRSTGLTLAIPADVVAEFLDVHRQMGSSDSVPPVSDRCG